MQPKQFVKQAGWRLGKKHARRHRVLSPEQLDKLAGSLFITALVPLFAEGYDAAVAYVSCHGRDTEWRDFYQGRRGVQGC